jgi:hypothetical protein
MGGKNPTDIDGRYFFGSTFGWPKPIENQIEIVNSIGIVAF